MKARLPQVWRSMRRFALGPLLVWSALLAGAPSSALDYTAPTISAVQVNDCNGVYHSTLETNIANPTLRLTVQDQRSGLHRYNHPLIAGSSSSLNTMLFYDFNTDLAGPPRVVDVSSNNMHAVFQGSGGGPCTGADDPCYETNGGPTTNPADTYLRSLRFKVDQGVVDTSVIHGVLVDVAYSTASLDNIIGSIAIEAWVKLDTTANLMPFVEFSTTSRLVDRMGPTVWFNSLNVFAGDTNTPGAIYANLVSSDSVNGIQSHIILAPGGSIPDTNYHLFALSYSKFEGLGVARLFVDGVQVSSRIIGAVSLRTDSEFRIGYSTRSWGATTPHGFWGRIDQFRVLARSLTSVDAAQDYRGGLIRFTPPGPPTGDYYQVFTDGETGPLTFNQAVPALGLGATALQITFSDRGGTSNQVNTQLNYVQNTPLQPTITRIDALTANSISYTWTAPPGICNAPAPTYRAYDCSDVLRADNLPGMTNAEAGFGANTWAGRKLSAVDNFVNRESDKTPCVSTYTLANPPGSLTATNITTTSLHLTWDIAGNPDYTRYGLFLYPDASRSSGEWRKVDLSANFTGNNIDITGADPGTTYYFTVVAFNGRAADGSGGAQTAGANLDVSTLVDGTTLTGAAVDQTTIRWTWPEIFGADYYDLVDDASAVLCAPGAIGPMLGEIGCISGPHGVDTPVTAHVRAHGPAGFGVWSPWVRVFTLAYAPDDLAVTAVSSTTATLGWLRNGNGDNTLYEVRRSTSEQMYGVISSFSAPGTSFVADKLLPATSYYFQLRSRNGDERFSAPAPTLDDPAKTAVKAVTLQSPVVTASSGPPTSYDPSPDIAALWHFDENAGTSVRDATGHGHDALLRCDFANCISTPTFSTGPSGLGPALRLAGQGNSYVAVTTGTLLDGGATPLTIEVWANPTTALQSPEATIVAKGSSTDYGYSLDVESLGGTGRWRFRVRDGANGIQSLSTPAALDANRWHHLTAVWTPTQQSFYVDGVQVATRAVTNVTRANGGTMTIGNRPLGNTATYNAPFSGSIDELRIINRAASASDAAQDYGATLPGLFVPPPPNDALRLTIPPDAFGGAVRLYVSNDPRNNSLTASALAVASGLSSPPAGYAFVPGSLFEIVAQVNGLPAANPLTSSVTVTIPYPDTDANGLVDGTNPPLEASRISVFRLEESPARWIQLPTTVDAVSKRVSGQTNHFSVFALFGTTGISNDLSVVVYPVPWKPGSGGRFDSATFAGRAGLRFDELPAEGSIRIFSLSGEQVIDLPFTASNAGTRIWDGRNSAGHNVASGVYFARVKASGGGGAILKIAIER